MSLSAPNIRRLLFITAIFSLFLTGSGGATLIQQPSQTWSSYQPTDTVQTRVNDTTWNYTTYNTTLENGTIITKTNKTLVNWTWKPGMNTYIFDIDDVSSRINSDGTVSVNISLSRNNLTDILLANPLSGSDAFNNWYMYNQRNITSSEYDSLVQSLSDVPFKLLQGTMITSIDSINLTSSSSVDVSFTTDPTDDGVVQAKLGNHSLIVSAETQTDWNQGQFNGTTAGSDSLGQKAGAGDLHIGYENGTPSDLLNGFWRLDKESGFSLDYSGEGNNGTVNGDTVRGLQGVLSTSSYRFDGSGDYVEVSDDNSLDFGTGNMTIAFWMNMDEDDTRQCIVCKSNGGNPNYFVETNPSGSTTRIRFQVGNSNTNRQVVTDGNIEPDDGWIHVVAVADAANSELKVYFDGEENATTSGDWDSSDSSQPFMIGAVDNPQNPVADFYDGRVDEVRVYDDALTSQEVKQLYFYGRDGEFNGEYNRTGVNIPSGENLYRIEASARNISTPNNVTWVNVSEGGGCSNQVQLSSGTQNYSLSGCNNTGGTADTFFNFTADTPQLSPIISTFKLWTIGGNFAPSVDSITASPDPVGTNNQVTVKANVTDDGNLDTVEINLTDAAGNQEVDRDSMTNDSSIPKQWSYQYTPSEESSNIGTWLANVTATDTNGLIGTNNTTFDVNDATPPKWRNLQDNITGFANKGQIVNISSEWRDNGTGVNNVFLSTNDSGSFKNYTSQPKDCFQQFADQEDNSTQQTGNDEDPPTDGSCNQNYSGTVDNNIGSNFQDGNWSTSEATLGTFAYMNYSKPDGSLKSIKWEVKDGVARTNLTIPDFCKKQSPLQLRAQDDSQSDDVYWSCHNGTTWNTLRDTTDSSNGGNIFEEGIWWNVASGESFSDVTNTWVLADLKWQNTSFLGALGYKMWGKDADSNWNVTKTGTVEVSDLTPPNFRNFQNNITGDASTGQAINISSEWRDNGSGMLEAYLATNETGSFTNYTANKDQYGIWSLSNPTFNGETSTSYARGMEVSDGGAYLFTSGQKGFAEGKIERVDLSTEWDVAGGGTVDDSETFGTNGDKTGCEGPHSIAFNESGTEMYLGCDDTGGTIYQYSLSTAWKPSTATQTESTSTVATNVAGLDISSDGKYVVFMNSDTSVGGDLHTLELSDPYNISSATNVESNDGLDTTYDEVDGNLFGATLGDSGKRLVFVAGTSNINLTEFSLNDPWNVSSVNTLENSYDLSQETSTAYDTHYRSSGTQIYVSDGGSTGVLDYTIEGIADAWVLSDFVWNNNSFKGNLGYKIWGTDVNGNWNVTGVDQIKVTSNTFNESSTETITTGDQATTNTESKKSTDDAVTIVQTQGEGLTAETKATEQTLLQSTLNTIQTLVTDKLQQVSVADAFTPQISVVRTQVRQLSVTDTVDTVYTAFEQASQTITLSDSFVETFVAPESFTQTITLSDSFVETFVASESFTQTITLSDSFVETFVASESFTQTITLSDTVATGFETLFERSQTITLSDRLDRGIETARDSFNQIITLQDTLSQTLAIAEGFNQQITLTDTTGIVYTAVEQATQPIQLNQAFKTRFTPIETFTEQPTLSDAFTSTFIVETATLEQITTATQNDVDKTITASIFEAIAFDSFFFENAPPVIDDVQVNAQGLGNSPSLTLNVSARDPDGNSDRDTLSFNGESKQITTIEKTLILDIKDDLAQSGTVEVADGDTSDTYDIDFNISNNAFTQDTSIPHNLSTQKIQKNDSLDNQHPSNNISFNVSVNTFDQDIVSETNKLIEVRPSTTNYTTTTLRGDFLTDTITWKTRPGKYQTVEKQFIQGQLDVTSKPDNTNWTDVNTTQATVPSPFPPCSGCNSSNISFIGTYTNNTQFTDQGDGINNEFVKDLADVIIGKRTQWWEQYKYNNLTADVAFNDIWANATINDNKTDFGGFILIEAQNTFNNTLDPKQTSSCTTQNPLTNSLTVDNTTFNACMKDRNGNDRPEFFKLQIGSFSTYNVRYGGNIGEEEAVFQRFIGDPCPDDEEVEDSDLETFRESDNTNDLTPQFQTPSNTTIVCYRNLYQTPEDALLKKAQVADNVGRSIAGIITLFGIVAIIIFFVSRTTENAPEQPDVSFTRQQKPNPT